MLSKKNTVNSPAIQFAGDTGKLYTVLMSDPDAPAKSWLHWLITNIPGESNDILQGETVMEYAGPNPPSGIHRYVFTLYEQPGGSIMVSQPAERGNFPVDQFEGQYSLKKISNRIVRVAK
jgi:phosphatidylethanolamine-binding protein (PEBP) family uncharacterized protein